MCLICIEFQKGKMTVEEGWRNLSEMEDTIPKEHRTEVEEMLWDNFVVAHIGPSHINGDEPWHELGVDDETWYDDHGQGD